LNLLEERIDRLGLREDGADARIACAVLDYGAFVQREKNDGYVRKNRSQCHCRIESVHARHGEIHDDQVRMKLAGFFNCVHAIHCFAANVESGLGL